MNKVQTDHDLPQEYLALSEEEKASYDRWFKAEVEQALCEADDPNTVWIPHEQVMKELDEQIARLSAVKRDQRED